ncbi:glycosyltransferase [Ferruginibacter albus]|uniref:glycosyltransferase n=1 Tax=Ferruginibacter albus TaxID=2875540 RepID=UPI001CC72EDD|nr:glycosyltransferase [Ferruginibacter albus]UAY52241.1 glycosyltransferase [Ferruginibacter albus]
MKKILFVVPFPKKIYPSERFRVEIYEQVLKDAGFEYDTVFFWDYYARSILYKKGRIFQKAIGVLKGFIRRFQSLFIVSKYDYVFVLREAAPVGPPVFEWIYSKILRKKLIYDFDDAIWIPQISTNNSWAKFTKAFWKVKKNCRRAYKVSVGNDYLYNYAIQYNPSVIINPTCVDTINKHNVIKDQATEKVVIGWTGSFSTLHYLNEIVPVLQQLEQHHDFEFIVIADQNPHLPLKSFRFIEWKEATEIADLMQFNIGVMPLSNDEVSKGKSGFKLIQFMSLGIPVVASPIGVNQQIVDENINGFLCKTESEWINAFEKLICDEQLRQQMGNDGRKKIEKRYSVVANKENFLSLFS